MRRSAHVIAPLLASTAVALLAGCHQQPEMQRCVDEQDHVVDPSFCKNLPPNSANPVYSTPGMTGGVYVPHFYRYYYGGLGGYGIGSLVSGGGYAPVTGHSYSSTRGVSSSTVRGGFGRSFSSSGGHSSGGGE